MSRFLRRFLAVSLGGICVVGLLNWIVDPYDRFGLNRLGVYTSASRESKLRRASVYPHNALLVGNSRVAMTPATQLRGYRFYNAGMDGASLAEVRLFLERNLRPHELVVLNLDHYILGFESDIPPATAFQPLTPQLLGNYLLNLKSVEYSFRTIARSLAGVPPNYGVDGTTVSADWRRDRDIQNAPWRAQEILTARGHAGGFRWTPARREELVQIRQLVEARQGRLIVFFSPVHEEVVSALETGPAAKEWAEAVRQVRELFPGVVDLTHSSYSQSQHFAWTDPVHFFPEIGLAFLNERVLPKEQ